MRVIAINRSRGIAMLDTDEIIPFSNMYDADGNETDDGTQCVSAVVPLPNGQWEVIQAHHFVPVSIN